VPCPGGSCVGGQSSTTYDLPPLHGIDLLVVMDDSASMAAHQDDVVTAMAPVLDLLPGGPELRVRVVSSSVPTPGLAGFPGCVPTEQRTCLPSAGYLEATRVCGRQSNFSGKLSEAFDCLARVGTAGCGWEQPLAAARAALEGDPQDGSHFLRRDAFLFVLVVSDEDDCSVAAGASPFGAPPTSPDDPVLSDRCRAAAAGGLVPVGDYASFFRGLKARPDQQVTVSVLSGWPGDRPPDQPACQRNGSPVLPAPRLRTFMEAFGALGSLVDLCTQDPRAALARLGERLAIKLSNPCLPEGLVDGAPAVPGVQPICTVTETTVDAAGNPVAERALPTCESGASPPCWRAEEDLACTSGVKAGIERTCQVGAPTRITFRCATTPSP
jgi:hypothetical protein